MARSFLGVPAAVLGLTLSLLLSGCYGAYQVKADHPTGAGTLVPTIEDKDAGLVGSVGGFDLKAYPVIAISLFPVTDLAVKDEGDRRTAASMSAFFHSELVRRMRESGLFTRVVNLTETPWQPGAEKALRLDGRITRLGEGSQAARLRRPLRRGQGTRPERYGLHGRADRTPGDRHRGPARRPDGPLRRRQQGPPEGVVR